MTKPRAIAIGATGMLAEAAMSLAETYDLDLLARNPVSLAEKIGANPIPVDWHDREAADKVLASLDDDFEFGLFWLHDTMTWASARCEAKLRRGGRLVRVHGSASAEPSTLAKREPDPRHDITRQHVILGYHPAKTRKIWLSHKEICAGTLAAIKHPELKRIEIGTRIGA